MRKVTLTGREIRALYDSLNMGDPQRGLNMSDIRTRLPLFEKIESRSNKKVIQTQQGPQEILEFKDSDLILKESEYSLCINVLENSGGWLTMEAGIIPLKLAIKLKEVPLIEEKEDQK